MFIEMLNDFARLPSSTKALKSSYLNRMGFQTGRTIAAHGLHRWRTRRRPEHVWARAIRDQGYCAIPNFLNQDVFDALKKESLTIMGTQTPASVRNQGPTKVRQFRFLDFDEQKTLHLRAFLRHPLLIFLIQSAEGRSDIDMMQGNRFLEEVGYHESDEEDPESQLHVDIFFSNHKAWLYLDDVDDDQGPLVYVPNSHRLDLTRLRYHYQEASTDNRPSRRVSAQEVQDRGLQEKAMRCPANTLVIADTFGYHRRIFGQPGQKRRAIQLSFRENPFLGHRLESTLRKWVGL